MFLAFLDSRGGTGDPLINVCLKALSTKFAFKYSPLKTEFVLCFWPFWTVEGGGPLVNVSLRAF